MGFTYAYFPYPMEDIHGELVFREDNFEIRHLEARNGSALVSFDGKGGGYASEADFRFRLRIRNMPLNHTLKNALGDGTGATIWNLFGDPTGSIDADGWIERDRGPDLPVRTPLDIGLREVSFQYAGFPYPARHVNGTIRVELPRVTVLHVETSHPRWQVSPLGLIPDRSASFRIHGWVDDIDTDPSLDLFLKGRAIELDERIRKALGETGEDLWKRLQPTGVVDLDWHVRKRSGEEAVHAGVARLLGCTMEYDEIPLPVSGLTGEVRYRPERIELVALQGKSGDAEISLKGSLEEKTTQVDVRAVGLDLEPGTVEDLPREVREILQTLKLEGTVNADVNLAIHHGKERKIIGGVVLRVTDGEIKGDVPIKNMVGDAHLDVYVQGEEMLLSGPLQFSRITILGKEVKRLSTSLRKVGSNLSFLNLQGSVYEGVLTGEMNFDTKSDRFSGHLQVANLNLKSYSDSTQEFKDSESPEGKVDIEIRNLKGTGSDTATITGSGKITISQGRLWQVPVFAGLFSLDPTKWGGEPVFDAGSIYFDIADRKFRIKTLGFEGKGTSIVGKGEVDFDGNLDLKLRMESGSLFGIDFFLFRIPVQVVDILRNAILPIKVTGTLDEPKVNK